MKGWIIFERSSSELKPNSQDDYSANRFLETAPKLNIDLDVISKDRFEVKDDKIFLDNLEVTNLPDFIIPRVYSGINQDFLNLIKTLENKGALLINGSFAIEHAENKFKSQEILEKAGLPVPKAVLINKKSDLNSIKKSFDFPAVLKTLSGTQGQGVSLINSLEELESSLSEQDQILQEFISESSGRDLRVFTIGGKAIACMQRKAKEGFKANFHLGAEVTNFPLNDEIRELGAKVATALKLDITGIDLLFCGDAYLICEANYSPGFEGLEKSTNLDIAKLILEMVRSKLLPC